MTFTQKEIEKLFKDLGLENKAKRKEKLFGFSQNASLESYEFTEEKT